MTTYSYDGARELLAGCVGDRLEEAGYGMFATARISEIAAEAMLTFDGLMAIAEQWLDEHYPIDVPIVCDREAPDPGPRLAAALRDCLEAHR